MNTLGLANKVKLNLIYSIQWSNMITFSILNVDKQNDMKTSKILNPNNETYILKGTNPRNEKEEYVLALSKRTKVTLENMDLIFKYISMKLNVSVEKLLLAIVDTDGSIMYNYISRGVKSVQNII